MSEPVIKAVGRRCPKCREYADHAIPWLHCSFCDVDTVELYARDDLARMKREFETLAMGAAVGVALVMGALKACDATPADADRAMRAAIVATITHACGPCDHVGECGDYECRPGVDGWQLKAGAR